MLKLLALAFVAADKAVATLEAEDGERVALEVECTSDEVLAPLGARFKVPEAEAFTGDDAAKLAGFRKEFEATKDRSYETSQGKGQAQIELQNLMHPLMQKERKAKVSAAVAACVASSPADVRAQLRAVRDERDIEVAAGDKLRARVLELEAALAAAQTPKPPSSSAPDSQSASTPASGPTTGA